MTADASKGSSQFREQLRPRAGRTKDLMAGPHGPKSPLFVHAAQFTPDYEYWFEDFTQTAITATTGPFEAGNPYTLTYAESNAGATDPAKLTPTAAQSSDLSLATTANATYAQSIIGPKMYTANKFPFFEVRFQVSQVTDIAFVIGFADAIPASAGNPVTDIDTPAVGTVADGAFYAIDTAQTLTTAALVAVGTSTAVNKVNVAPTGAPFGVPTAATYVTVRVALEGNGNTGAAAIARLYVNDALVATNATGPDCEKLLSCFFYQRTPGGTALTSTIDYMRAGQSKAGSPF